MFNQVVFWQVNIFKTIDIYVNVYIFKGKGSCFIAGTKVSLGQSFKNIEDIKIGDIVLSYNE